MAPLGVYARHADAFLSEEVGVDGDVEERMAFKLLRGDPEARLLLYCAYPLLFILSWLISTAVHGVSYSNCKSFLRLRN